jgi:hypothetical protein
MFVLFSFDFVYFFVVFGLLSFCRSWLLLIDGVNAFIVTSFEVSLRFPCPRVSYSDNVTCMLLLHCFVLVGCYLLGRTCSDVFNVFASCKLYKSSRREPG